MPCCSGQDRYGLARGWLIASIVSAGGCSAFAGDASLGQGPAAGWQPSPLKREAPVFTYRQFTSRLPALPDMNGETEPADHAPAAPPSGAAQAGPMDQLGSGSDATSSQGVASSAAPAEGGRQADEPGTTAAVPQRAAPQDLAGARRNQHAAPVLLGSGRASWYKHSGRTASGQVYNPDALTAAHHTLPFGTKVKVVNKRNGRAVVVEITDRTNERTKLKRNYAIDLSRASARKLGIDGIGLVALYKVD